MLKTTNVGGIITIVGDGDGSGSVVAAVAVCGSQCVGRCGGQTDGGAGATHRADAGADRLLANGNPAVRPLLVFVVYLT